MAAGRRMSFSMQTGDSLVVAGGDQLGLIAGTANRNSRQVHAWLAWFILGCKGGDCAIKMLELQIDDCGPRNL